MDDFEQQNTYEWSGMQYYEASACTMQRNPIAFPWGYISIFNVDSPAGIGYDMHWFASKEELIAYLIEIEPQLLPIYEDENYDLAREKTATCLHNWQLGEFDIEITLDQLSEIFDPYVEFIWLGRFEELTAGASDLAIDLRLGFRDSLVEDGLSDLDGIEPLTDEELSEFIAYLVELALEE
ncbi:MAG: hypothetical protein ABFD29_06810 [Anaerolineaceae bacterium]